MKRIVLFAALFGFMSSVVFAQDDMYFTPKKQDKAEAERQDVDIDSGWYSAASYGYRDVDEYNRRGRFADSYSSQDLDTLYSDVIFMDSVQGDSIWADTMLVADDFDYAYTPEDDYTYSRQMSRYDDFYWHDPWYYGWYGSPYWYGSYWYGSPYWYAGWWYDPWYDPWYYGWHRPWGWYYPVYSYYRPYRGVTGTSNHGHPYGRHNVASGNFRGYRGSGNAVNSNRGFNSNRYSSDRNRTNYNNRFRGNRQNTYNSNNNFNNNNFPSRSSFNNGGSFGGNRSGSFRGGGSFGGSRGGGGGGFRGRR